MSSSPPPVAISPAACALRLPPAAPPRGRRPAVRAASPDFEEKERSEDDDFDEFDDDEFDDEFDDDFEEEFDDEYEVEDDGFSEFEFGDGGGGGDGDDEGFEED